MLTTLIPFGGNVGRGEGIGVDVVAGEVEETFAGGEADELLTDTVRVSTRKLVITVVMFFRGDRDVVLPTGVDGLSAGEDGGLLVSDV